MENLLGQIIKTKSGNKTWRVRRIDGDKLIIEGTTNFKFKRLNIDQYHKTWRIV